ncbi:ABC transporter ATP-binding protein [Agrococcus sp. Marseille-P2731]|uniref:ABC transporter ATP-binding protein n=1 Tax=Agrococcus sp. Marseille-P2731 TaxID=1841862 RepID=UPI000931ADEB|nr:ATP-binding cassette domain-containing protein [Agrococcus sp. Marseille-P2731]
MRYDHRVVLDEVSFHAPWGAVTGFIGVNGSGKTTTIRCMLGLERGGGRTRMAGVPYAELDEPLRTVGFCPDSLGAAPWVTAQQHIRTLALRAGADATAAASVLQSVGLTAVSQPVRAYSLGMRRRLAIAGALVASPGILVLDEPFDGLDPEGRRWLAELLRAHADDGGAVLLSAHALDEIEPLLDRVVCLHEGRVRYAGAAEPFLRAGAAEVTIVRSLDQARLADALRAAGATVRSRASGAVAVRALTPEQIARVASDAAVLVTELTPRRTTLSAAFATAIEAAP